jgi:hypothetical protein
MSTGDEKAAVTRKRLLFAKELYSHGLEHSDLGNDLNWMLAVHHFHHSVETALRTIMLDYGIRSEKTLNITFEVMLNEIDGYFKDVNEKQKKLPLRRELMILNELRNHVQHHALAPSREQMERCRVHTRDFLIEVCNDYFGLDFESLSRLDWIEDELLKKGLRLAEQDIEENDFKKSLLLSTIVFTWAARAVAVFLPDRSSRLDEALGAVEQIRNKNTKVKPDLPELAHLYVRVRAAEYCLEILANETRAPLYYAAVLTSGVRLKDFRKFGLYTPEIASSGRYPRWSSSVRFEDVKKPDVRWVRNFVIDTILNWQSLGLQPRVPDHLRQDAKEILTNGDPTWKGYIEDL